MAMTMKIRMSDGRVTIFIFVQMSEVEELGGLLLLLFIEMLCCMSRFSSSSSSVAVAVAVAE